PLSFSHATPPPPTSPLFPYTTPFRSLPAGPVPDHPPGRPDLRPGRGGVVERVGRQRADLGDRLVAVEPLAPRVGAEGFELAELLDRKSTRLNSSHVAISYAVFCLKKR